MNIRLAAPVVIVGALLAGCGSESPVFTPGYTAPVYTPAPGGVSPGVSPTANATQGAPTAAPTPTPAPTPAFDAATFPTVAGAHDYAAQRSAAYFKAALVTDPAKCPSAQGAACYVESKDHVASGNVEYFTDGIGFNPTGAADIVYLYQDATGWHWMDSLGTQAGYPSKGQIQIIQVDKGCANIHSSDSTQSSVVTCLKSGEQVTIDSDPTYADGHIWWHLSDRNGWVAHENLISGFVRQAQT